ncbi:hypothetical protein [Roseobacter litoralis]|uniref:hypothetical protein n=1 Tax=Roseobacter litoralis TaxID=42443 RepID=UPI00249457E6|nr:hypothetical protein [Roseobacter litoralis]
MLVAVAFVLGAFLIATVDSMVKLPDFKTYNLAAAEAEVQRALSAKDPTLKSRWDTDEITVSDCKIIETRSSAQACEKGWSFYATTEFIDLKHHKAHINLTSTHLREGSTVVSMVRLTPIGAWRDTAQRFDAEEKELLSAERIRRGGGSQTAVNVSDALMSDRSIDDFKSYDRADYCVGGSGISTSRGVFGVPSDVLKNAATAF